MNVSKETAYNTSQEKSMPKSSRYLYRADTIEELAVQIGVNPQVLVETIKNYNSYVDAGFDPEFNKGSFDLTCEVAPFYATPRKSSRSPYNGWTQDWYFNTRLEWKRSDYPGLYAAGEVPGGLHAGNRLGRKFAYGYLYFWTYCRSNSC